MQARPTVLILGCGIAGPTLAYWLTQIGYQVTIVEKSPDLRTQGYMIDFYGSGFDVAEKMGIIERLRARHYPMSRLDFVDEQGRTRASLNIEKFRQLLKGRHFNFMRGDLAQVLYDTIKDSVAVRFGLSVAGLEQRPDGVDVTFTDQSQQTFDLVVGADGMHSTIRKLVWGDESDFARYLGYYVACSIIDDRMGAAPIFQSHVAPGQQAAVYSIRGSRLATFFVWKSPPLHDLGRQERFAELKRAFANVGWIVPRLLGDVERSDDFYFDSVTQISMDPWHHGRVTLVGDACQCLTLIAGQGASLAMAGGYLLAQALQQAQGEHEAAFRAYQARLKPEADARQEQARKFAGTFVPGSRLGILMDYVSLKVMFLPFFRSVFLRRIGAKSVIH